jgi:membrane protease YdiL (CAAX protease family)
VKICHYCGKENENMLEFCAECGTALVVAEESLTERISTTSWLKSLTPHLTAASATVILLASLAVPTFCGVLLGILNVVKDSHGMDVSEQGKPSLNGLARGISITIPIVSGLVSVCVSKALIPQLRDTSPNGAAWVRGSWVALARGLVIGMVLGTCLIAVNEFIKSHVFLFHVTRKELGPVDQMAYEHGLPQMLWIILGVLLAPLPEEILFRGVLYGGYRKSFGPISATILTTLIFVSLHLLDVIRYPPNVVALTALSLAALWCRLRSAAIGPAIAVHVGYNTVMSLLVVLRTWR